MFALRASKSVGVITKQTPKLKWRKAVQFHHKLENWEMGSVASNIPNGKGLLSH